MRSIDVVVEAVVTFAGAAGFAHTLAPLRRGQQDPCFRVPGDGTIWRTSLLPTGPVTARISRAGRDAARCVAWGSGAEEFVDMAPAMLGAADDASDFVPLHPAVAAAHRRCRTLRLGRTGQVLDADNQIVSLVADPRATDWPPVARPPDRRPGSSCVPPTTRSSRWSPIHAPPTGRPSPDHPIGGRGRAVCRAAARRGAGHRQRAHRAVSAARTGRRRGTPTGGRAGRTGGFRRIGTGQRGAHRAAPRDVLPGGARSPRRQRDGRRRRQCDSQRPRMSARGTLWGVGLGPGDPELVTSRPPG